MHWLLVLGLVGSIACSGEPAPQVVAPLPEPEDPLAGLEIAPENRCSKYNRGDYPYPQSVEADLIEQFGGVIYGPYTGTVFSSRFDTHIEHIVALAEAHDSGACAWTNARRSEFARDLNNLTLAAPSVNQRKSSKDAAEWLPDLNRCWFAGRVRSVKLAYRLTVDQAEANALSAVLRECSSTDMVGP